MINKFIQLIISKIISNPNHSKFEYLEPKGDPGLFGPNSITWIVHKDFISMMIGGISSLIFNHFIQEQWLVFGITQHLELI